jgi:hypothetical protein
LLALGIQHAEHEPATPQAKPPKTTTQFGCSPGTACAKRRTPVDFEYGNMMRRLMDIAECW